MSLRLAYLRGPSAGEAFGPSNKPLLSPGNEAEWAKVNREEARQARAANLELTPVQRLQQGQRLSQQAVSLLAASIKAGNAQDELSGPDLAADPPLPRALGGPPPAIFPVEPIPGLDR